MRVTIVGGWSTNAEDHEGWDLRLGDEASRRAFAGACELIGRRLAEKGHTVVVGSDEPNSADYHVVRGFLAAFGDRHAPGPLIRLIQGIEGEGGLYPEARASERHGRLFQGIPSRLSGERPRAAEKILALNEADALIALGGLETTYVAGIAALAARKPVIPIASFGGAALQLWRALPLLRDAGGRGDLDRLADEAWSPAVADAAFRFGGLDRPRVFLGSSGRADALAREVVARVEAMGFDVVFWRTDFRPTRGILDELREAAFTCKYALFLLTPDDLVAGEAERRVPRDNVVFEAGFFLSALGRGRTALVVQRGVDVLDDYEGHIWIDLPESGDAAAIEPGLRAFLTEDLPAAR